MQHGIILGIPGFELVQRPINTTTSTSLLLSQEFINDMFEDEGDNLEKNEFNIQIDNGKPGHICRSRISIAYLTLLSYELVIQIFSFLHNKIDLFSAMNVSKYFLDLSQSDELWRSLCTKANDLKSSIPAHIEMTVTSPIVSSPVAVTQDPWTCEHCSLIQALVSSTHCEMCGTPRPTSIASDTSIVMSPHVIIQSAAHFAQLWIEGRRETDRILNLHNINMKDNKDNMSSKDLSHGNCNIDADCKYHVDSKQIIATESTAHSTDISYWHLGCLHKSYNSIINFEDKIKPPIKTNLNDLSPTTSYQHINNQNYIISNKNKNTIYFNCKVNHIDRHISEHWEMFSTGWEWIIKEYRRRLSRIWEESFGANLNTFISNFPNIIKEYEKYTDSNHIGIKNNSVNSNINNINSNEKQDNHHQNYLSKAIENEFNILQQEKVTTHTLEKIVKKLCTKHWVRYYDDLKCELNIQAEALSLDLRSIWIFLNRYGSEDNKKNIKSCMNSSHIHLSHSLSLSLSTCKEMLFIYTLERAFTTYLDWTTDLEEYCWILTDRIVNEREGEGHSAAAAAASTLSSSSGVLATNAPHTPHISDMSLLALRSHALMQPWLTDVLRHCLDVISSDAERENEETVSSTSTSTQSQIPQPIRSALLYEEENNKPKKDSIACLMRFYSLIQLLDVSDDSLSHEIQTQQILHSLYLNRLQSLPCLAYWIRALEEKKRQERIHFGWPEEAGDVLDVEEGCTFDTEELSRKKRRRKERS
eukprot:gene6710-13598_t